MILRSDFGQYFTFVRTLVLMLGCVSAFYMMVSDIQIHTEFLS
jgi:hypothetical protein